MTYEVVMTSDEMVAEVKHIRFDLKTKYNNHWPYNLGYNHGGWFSWDCWNFYPKTLVWGWSEDIPAGEYQHKNLGTGLGDWNGWTILNCCNEISKAFGKILPGEFLLLDDKSHAGCYVGEFEKDGRIYNVIECTGAFGGGVVSSYVDGNGYRYSCRGGNRNGRWGWHGKLPWLDYNAYIQPLAVDGWWGMATTRYTQKMFGTPIDGIISRQNRANKKYLPNASTSSWEFVTFRVTGSDVIKAIQKLIGTDPDGDFGAKSVTALERFLKAKGFYDGEIEADLGKRPSMGPGLVKAWQRYINAYFRA